MLANDASPLEILPRDSGTVARYAKSEMCIVLEITLMMLMTDAILQ
jgi:hypothetical protein